MSTFFLPNSDVARLDEGFCIDCGHRGFILGPRGGAGMNIECGSLSCRARYNVAQFPFSHHIVMAQRLPRQSEGGADWTVW